MHLTRGQNTVLPTTAVRFTVGGGLPVDVSALVVDADLQALSSESFVFYNQPHTGGVRMGAGGVDIDLDAVRPDAHAVLCIVSVDPLAATGTVFTAVVAALHDRAGRLVAGFDIDCRAGETAVICWELYRRAGQWKIRAVGQGYADGLAGLITRHGVDVDDDPAPAPQATVPDTGAPGPVEPFDPNHTVERFGMILEDAARSAGALIEARRFAEARLDHELSVAVADPAARTGPAAQQARTVAQQRHDTVVDDAQARYRHDSDQLAAELDAIAPLLPRSCADWAAPAWSATPAPYGPANGIRIGELSAPGCGPLRVPLVLPFPLGRPLRIVGADTAATASVTAAAILRILAADPAVVLDVVDLTGHLRAVTTGVAHRVGATVTRPDSIGSFLESAAAAAELALLDGAGGSAATPRLIVLGHFPYGYDQRQLPAIAFLAEHGHRVGVTVIVVADDSTDTDPTGDDPMPHGYALPADDNDDWRDPWTGNTWTFTPDRAPADLGRILGALTDPATR
ncbi:TerD family protein [Prescottella sp. R16]|uniref:TerD family protein n=1 Tax=Prescottella sp. R16 TaxID=3064529 RepID=UPI00272EB880|nr:TerD family protein [Prescottella sp. R16]